VGLPGCQDRVLAVAVRADGSVLLAAGGRLAVDAVAIRLRHLAVAATAGLGHAAVADGGVPVAGRDDRVAAVTVRAGRGGLVTRPARATVDAALVRLDGTRERQL